VVSATDFTRIHRIVSHKTNSCGALHINRSDNFKLRRKQDHVPSDRTPAMQNAQRVSCAGGDQAKTYGLYRFPRYPLVPLLLPLRGKMDAGKRAHT
jgi:hypothetical protein